MPPLLVNQGAIAALNTIRAQANTHWRVKLFQNNYNPALPDAIGNYVEASFPGYAQKSMGFNAAVQDGNGKARCIHAQMSFQHSGSSGSNVIYGWYIVDSSTNQVVFAERFTAPRSMGASGDVINITPNLTMRQDI